MDWSLEQGTQLAAELHHRRLKKKKDGIDSPNNEIKLDATAGRAVAMRATPTVWMQRFGPQIHMIETVTQSVNTSQLRLTHTQMLATISEPPEPDEQYDAALRDDAVWKLIEGLFGCRKAPKLWHQQVVSILEQFLLSPTLDRSKLFQKR